MALMLIGNSHITRYQRYLTTRYNDNVFQLSDSADVNTPIIFHGISGGQVTNSAHVRSLGRAIAVHRPKCLIMQIGGNDLDRQGLNNEIVEEVIFKLCSLAKLWLEQYHLTNIVIAQLLPRFRTRHVPHPVYNDFVKQGNALLKQELSSSGQIRYWRLKGLKQSQREVYCDGVHMNNVGFAKYHKNIRGAVIHCLS